MKDVIYAGFAQLSYLDWHKLPEYIPANDKKINILVEKYFDKIRTEDYDKIYSAGKDYLRIEDGKKIYSEADNRMLMLYSEDEVKAEQNPKYPEFGDWEFVCGCNHENINMLKGYLTGNVDCREAVDNGFQASAFKKGTDIIIAYRGSNDMFKMVNFMTDWIDTNLKLGTNMVPTALTYAVIFYDYIKKTAGSKNTIHITGHSMGGALAQYVAIYANGAHKTVTWSGLGIGKQKKRYDNKDAAIHYSKYCSNYPVDGKNKHVKDSITNYYMKLDTTPNLQQRVGKVICIDDKRMPTEDKKGSEFGRKYEAVKQDEFSVYHSISNIIPFLDKKGNIRQEEMSENFTKNLMKTIFKNELLISPFSKREINTMPAAISLDKIDKNNNGVKPPKKVLSKKEIYTNIEDAVEKIGKEILWKPILKENIKRYENNWCIEKADGIDIGAFNNCGDIGGVIGGKLLHIKYSKKASEGRKSAAVYIAKAGSEHLIEHYEETDREKSYILINRTVAGTAVEKKRTGENEWREEYANGVVIDYSFEGKNLVLHWKDKGGENV